MYLDYLRPIKRDGTLKIAMACDFFHPNIGGVENHIYSLSECLLQRGHRVIVITHSYGPVDEQRQGVRYMPCGLKVYYIPLIPFYKQVTFMTGYGNIPIIREILIREQVDIVHCHSSFSCFGIEAMMNAHVLGIHTVFTDHSLSGFADLSAVSYNKVLEFELTMLDNAICVSHTCKENIVLRTLLKPDQVFVIPNAIESSCFTPDVTQRDNNYVTVVVIARLTYRKGLDLLVSIIPPLCGMFPQLRFLIAGDGPKRLELEELRERHHLHSRINLIGHVENSQVRSILVQGDIFVNSSLTEAFCIALLEAVSCGLLVVTTMVGGIPEVLPEKYMRLTPVEPSAMAVCLANAIQDVLVERQSSIDSPSLRDSGDTNMISERAWLMHNWVRDHYSWPQVAERTEAVYFSAMTRKSLNTFERFEVFLSRNSFVSGLFHIAFSFVQWMILQITCWIRPEQDIDRVPDFNFLVTK